MGLYGEYPDQDLRNRLVSVMSYEMQLEIISSIATIC